MSFLCRRRLRAREGPADDESIVVSPSPLSLSPLSMSAANARYQVAMQQVSPSDQFEGAPVDEEPHKTENSNLKAVNAAATEEEQDMLDQEAVAAKVAELVVREVEMNAKTADILDRFRALGARSVELGMADFPAGEAMTGSIKAVVASVDALRQDWQPSVVEISQHLAALRDAVDEVKADFNHCRAAVEAFEKHNGTMRTANWRLVARDRLLAFKSVVWARSVHETARRAFNEIGKKDTELLDVAVTYRGLLNGLTKPKWKGKIDADLRRAAMGSPPAPAPVAPESSQQSARSAAVPDEAQSKAPANKKAFVPKSKKASAPKADVPAHATKEKPAVQSGAPKRLPRQWSTTDRDVLRAQLLQEQVRPSNVHRARKFIKFIAALDEGALANDLVAAWRNPSLCVFGTSERCPRENGRCQYEHVAAQGVADEQ